MVFAIKVGTLYVVCEVLRKIDVTRAVIMNLWLNRIVSVVYHFSYGGYDVRTVFPYKKTRGINKFLK